MYPTVWVETVGDDIGRESFLGVYHEAATSPCPWNLSSRESHRDDLSSNLAGNKKSGSRNPRIFDGSPQAELVVVVVVGAFHSNMNLGNETGFEIVFLEVCENVLCADDVFFAENNGHLFLYVKMMVRRNHRRV